jgi:hypothetical protein
MKNTIMEFVSGAFILIGMYLVVRNWSGTTQVIKAVGGQTTSMFKTLQGR